MPHKRGDALLVCNDHSNLHQVGRNINFNRPEEKKGNNHSRFGLTHNTVGLPWLKIRWWVNLHRFVKTQPTNMYSTCNYTQLQQGSLWCFYFSMRFTVPAEELSQTWSFGNLSTPKEKTFLLLTGWHLRLLLLHHQFKVKSKLCMRSSK